ncbi:MAG: M23 family metallopeptidase [Corallococcus sp.]|nr:M23 family metallopeptidase [Corallococcus sp.]MCM1360022.1 M23 family metallopeptidase [Corallococcus sp.]MCM1395579.1 M23 family metallopeptidase [Corallococcus sp.]
MNTTKPKSKFSRFLKNNAALLLIIFCVLAITAVVLAVTLSKTSDPTDSPVVVDPNPDDNKPTVPDPVVPQIEKVFFASPIAASKITVQFNDGTDASMFEQSSTLGWWQAHMGVDIAANEGTDVTAMYDGTVIEVKYTMGMGNAVTIDHGDNVVATYASLGDVAVKKGDVLKKGDVVGTVSTTASDEYLDGAHLHLSVKKDGKYVNPAPYVNGDIFREVEVTKK